VRVERSVNSAEKKSVSRCLNGFFDAQLKSVYISFNYYIEEVDMKTGIHKALKREFDKQLKVWNLKCLEKKLLQTGFPGCAFTIRQALDLLSPNWRTAKDYSELEVN